MRTHPANKNIEMFLLNLSIKSHMYNIHRRMKISKCYSQILVKKMKKAGFPPQKHRFPYGITVFDTKKGRVAKCPSLVIANAHSGCGNPFSLE